MQLDLGILISVTLAVITVGAFFIARMKDAEERGALKQRVATLEHNQSLTEAKHDKMFEKLDAIQSDIRRIFSEHVKDYHA